MNYNQFFKEELNKLKAEGNYRVFADLEKIAGNFPQALNYKEDNVSEVTVWCSNDYLGMSQNDIVIESMIEAVKKVGAGSGGTRNISGTNHYHVLLERELRYLHQKEAALLFNSGYLANQATLSTLGKKLPDCVFFSDEKNHASMIQGMRNSGAKKIIFEHNNINDLENKLKINKSKSKVIVFESVYSMDGNFSPIKEICDLIKGHNCFFHVDAAQGFGKDIETLKNKRIDLMSISGHKIHGPKGIGALVTRLRNFNKPPFALSRNKVILMWPFSLNV